MTCPDKRITKHIFISTLILLSKFVIFSDYIQTHWGSVWSCHDVKYVLCCGLRPGYFELKTGLLILSLRCLKSISSIIFLAWIFLDPRFDASSVGFGRCLRILITRCPFLTLFTTPLGIRLRSALVCLKSVTLGNIKAFLLLTSESPELREDAWARIRRQIPERSWNEDQKNEQQSQDQNKPCIALLLAMFSGRVCSLGSWQWCSHVTMVRARKTLSPECSIQATPRPVSLPDICWHLHTHHPTKIRAGMLIYKRIETDEHIPLFFLFFLNSTRVYLTLEVICVDVINYKSQ